MTKFTIHFDGGCQPNPGQMYGSFSISVDGAEAAAQSRISLGHGTNNEAEFKTLIAAIKHADDIAMTLGLEKRLIQVEMLTDSKIVRNRVSGQKRDTARSLRGLEERYGSKAVESARRMAALAQECLKPLILYRSYEIKWAPREQNVARFGH